MGYWGIEKNSTGHGEKLISAVSGFIAILLTMWVSHQYLGMQGAAMLIASTGASAVLLFATPHAALSQPWPVLGGHVISALIGVSCAKYFPQILIAAPLALGLSIAAMHYLHCIHPPGGATTITAIIGSKELHELGFQYVLTPVLLNVVILLTLAVILNYPFAWRRYPAYLHKKTKEETSAVLSQSDFSYALSQRGTYVDIDDTDLSEIYRLASAHAAHAPAPGKYYSEGVTVRHVLSADENEINYCIVAGNTGRASRQEFMAWQKFEVGYRNGVWQPIADLTQIS